MSDKLTPKQGLFIAEYLVDGNATRAAIAAGYAASSAHVTGAKLLKNAKVAEIVAARHERRVEKLEITAERTLEEIAKLAYFDPGKLFDANGNLIPVHLLDDVTRASIASVEVEERKTSLGIKTVTKKVKHVDKGQNLERLGRYFKLFTDKHEHSGKLTLEQLVCGTDDEKEASQPQD
ncbi:MAG TPA: terminase small subunit [Alloacidobacterium sp.]|nr:terminase small subunit [Alloacidobacterium sp.]